MRITHLPSGIVVACQNERSQLRNRDTAMRMLRARLYQIYEQKQKEELGRADRGEEGHRVRQPDPHVHVRTRTSSSRTTGPGVEIGNVDAVMDGDIDPFIRRSYSRRR